VSAVSFAVVHQSSEAVPLLLDHCCCWYLSGLPVLLFGNVLYSLVFMQMCFWVLLRSAMPDVWQGDVLLGAGMAGMCLFITSQNSTVLWSNRLVSACFCCACHFLYIMFAVQRSCCSAPPMTQWLSSG
jgi:hypothetical protein